MKIYPFPKFNVDQAVCVCGSPGIYLIKGLAYSAGWLYQLDVVSAESNIDSFIAEKNIELAFPEHEQLEETKTRVIEAQSKLIDEQNELMEQFKVHMDRLLKSRNTSTRDL